MFQHVVIVGPGLIGGSLGMALRARRLAGKVVGVGHRRESLKKAVQAGAIDSGTLNLQSAVRDADLVVLATGVGVIPRQAAEAAPCMKKGAILTDVGSAKGSVCRAVEEALSGPPKSDVRFVGGHPLAGSEQRGIGAARRDLFRGAVCILTPSPRTDPDRSALAAVRAMWEDAGCAVTEMSPKKHDKLLAQISHLPHAAAVCLINAVPDDALRLAARGFLDTTRVASGDPALWADICIANRRALRGALTALSREMKKFACAADARDAGAILKILRRAKERRDAKLWDDGD